MRPTKKMTAFIALLLAICCAVVSVPVSVLAANAYTINGVTVRYTDVSSSPNECWVYANAIYKKIWGVNFSSYNKTSDDMLRNLSDAQITLTREHLREYISAAQPGASLRFCNSEYLHSDDGWGHSQILVAKSSSGFTVFHGGLSAYDYRAEQTYTWDSFMSSYFGTTYHYIKYIKWPNAPAYQPGSGSGTDDLTLSGANYPTKLNPGAAFVIQGYIYSGITNITKATVAVYDTAGNFKTGKENVAVNNTYYNIGNVDPYILFNQLAVGTYYYRIIATNSKGTKTLLNQKFTVGDPVSYTVTFKDWNGAVLKTQTVQQGDSASAPSSPSRTGYAFSGWDRAFTNVSANITVNAKYTICTYNNKITLWAWGFTNGEGNNSSKNAVLIGDSYFKKDYNSSYKMAPSMCTSTIPNGFYLAGSFLCSDINDPSTTFFSFDTTVVQQAKDMRFLYYCYPYQYKINYYLGGGTNSSANPSQYNVLYGVTFAEPTKTGYKFLGWTDENGNAVTGINAGGNASHTTLEELFRKTADRKTGDVTVYANWEKLLGAGDVDCNGKVDTTDLIMVKRHILGIVHLLSNSYWRADVDGNSIIDSTDYLNIRRHILGIRLLTK